MKTTDNITVTNGRLEKALKNRVEPIIMPQVTKQVNQAVMESKFQIGIMTKFYPYLDKCEIEVNGELILCKILHRFIGDLIDYYTPVGDEDYCTVLKEPCIIPRSTLKCLILDVNDDSDEQIMVGFINYEELIGINPAKMGNLKLVSRTETNQFWIKFGLDGLDIRSPETPTTSIGEYDSTMEEITYTNSNDVYTKAEVDKLLEDLKNEILGDDADESEG
ncbi:MAG: hypothetical protein J6M91_09740 [Methanobrevibacter sp.]|nr:hypothetical protein [Methanobrevibacter sp.]